MLIKKHELLPISFFKNTKKTQSFNKVTHLIIAFLTSFKRDIQWNSNFVIYTIVLTQILEGINSVWRQTHICIKVTFKKSINNQAKS